MNNSVIYKNGGCIINLEENGTRMIFGDPHTLEYPNSIDLKITNKCYYQCPCCHESSVPDGKEANLEKLIEKLNNLEGHQEIALGGGNPLLYSKLPELLDYLNFRGFIPNMTVRDLDIIKNSYIPESINALGISITPGINPETYINKVKNSNYVAHFILGFNDIQEFIDYSKYFPRILILGYKYFGRGKYFNLSEKITEWKKWIKQQIYKKELSGIISFDNLAIEQLDLKSSFLKKDWDLYYQGDDFSQSMYIDAVLGQYGKNSTDPNRISWDNLEIKEYYDKGITERRF